MFELRNKPANALIGPFQLSFNISSTQTEFPAAIGNRHFDEEIKIHLYPIKYILKYMFGQLLDIQSILDIYFKFFFMKFAGDFLSLISLG